MAGLMGMRRIGVGLRGMAVGMWEMRGIWAMGWECGEAGWEYGESGWECGEQKWECGE